MFGEAKLKSCVLTFVQSNIIIVLPDLLLLREEDEFGSKDPAAKNSVVFPRGIIRKKKYQMNLKMLAKMCLKGFVDDIMSKYGVQFCMWNL